MEFKSERVFGIMVLNLFDEKGRASYLGKRGFGNSQVSEAKRLGGLRNKLKLVSQSQRLIRSSNFNTKAPPREPLLPVKAIRELRNARAREKDGYWTNMFGLAKGMITDNSRLQLSAQRRHQ